MWADLTLLPSFKVKRWFTGFGELSFWWIQICIGSPMHRSSCDCIFSLYSILRVACNIVWDVFVLCRNPQTWKDDYLVWNATQYSGIDELVLSPELVWLPDFGIENRYK